MAIECPACGSSDLEFTTRTEEISAPFGPAVPCELEVVMCQRCEEEGDFSRVNDARIEAAMKQSVSASVTAMLDQLSDAGLSNAYIERVFDLPARTIARWKRGEWSSPVIAFLRLLCTFPWLARVADDRFAPREADFHVIRAFRDVMDRMNALARRTQWPEIAFAAVTVAIHVTTTLQVTPVTPASYAIADAEPARLIRPADSVTQ